MRQNCESTSFVSITTACKEGADQRVGSHSVFALNGSHMRMNVFIFEFLDGPPMNFKVDKLAVFRVAEVVNAFVGGCDLSVVGFKDRVFEEETKSGHLWDHHPSGTVHLISKLGEA